MGVAELLIKKVMDGDSVSSAVNSIVAKNNLANKGIMVLGYLRPNDKFTFLSPEISNQFNLTNENICTVVPSERGTIAFSSNNENAIHVSMEEAMQCYVQWITYDLSNYSERKFISGDRVKHRSDSKTGTVVAREPEGIYCIEFDNQPGTLSYIDSKLLILIDKDTTTKNYIAQNNAKWNVTIGNFVQETDSQLDALKCLYHKNRTAFNRYSKFAVISNEVQFDERCLNYLKQVDPQIWTNQVIETKKAK